MAGFPADFPPILGADHLQEWMSQPMGDSRIIQT